MSESGRSSEKSSTKTSKKGTRKSSGKSSSKSSERSKLKRKSKPKSKSKPKPESEPESEPKSSNSRKHPQITDDLPKAKRAKYYPRDLTRALRANTLTPIESRLDDCEMMALILRDVPSVNTERESYVLMNAYLPILDKAFFFGLVKRCLKGPVKTYCKPKAISKGYFDHESRTIHINLAGAETNGKDMAHSQLSTLLHEMTHAFFNFYSCTCSICKRKNSAAKGGEGKTGHGPAWINAMIVLQDSIQELVSWPVNCGIVQSVALEKTKSTKWKPRDEQLARWRIREKELQHHMEEMASRKKKDTVPVPRSCVVM